jgi:phosphoribosylglycinamide formyltransferase-1
MTPLRFAVLASGGGSNFQVLLDRIRSGDLPAEPAFVVSNNSRSPALEKARQAGVPAYHVSGKTEGSEDGVAAKIVEFLDRHRADWLVLAGYMKKIPEALLARLPGRILNIHPALLPAFGGDGYYGHLVHEAAVRRGVQFTGMTIHMVSAEYDAGQIVLQRAVAVPPGADAETVGRLVLAKEHDSYWRVLKAIADGEIVPTGGEDPARAVSISPDWLRRMRALDGIPD